MSCVLELPSLQHILCVKMAVHYWKTNAYVCEPMDWFDTASTHNWNKIKTAISEQVETLKSAEILKAWIKKYVGHLGNELHQWFDFLHGHCSLRGLENVDMIINKYVQWTQYGKIEWTKTAQVLCREAKLKPAIRFKIACAFCVVDVVGELWGPYSRTLKFFRVVYEFWTDLVGRKMRGIDIPFAKKLNVFVYAVSMNNESAVEYLWSIMSDEEKGKVQRMVLRDCNGGVGLFFVLQLDGKKVCPVESGFVKRMFRSVELDWVYSGFVSRKKV